MARVDVTVVGAGPNGLAAAVELLRSGRSVQVLEGASAIGGGTRTEELTLPGFRHDVCSAVHPTALVSPFFTEIGLDVEWIEPDIPLTHPLGDGDVVALHHDLDDTVTMLRGDGARYRSLLQPFLDHLTETIDSVLAPMTLVPTHPVALGRVGAVGALPASLLAAGFSDRRTKALIAGLAAHSVAPLDAPGTAGVGFFLGLLGHASGWPIARGGSIAVASDLADRIGRLGGEIVTDRRVGSRADVDGDVLVLDVMPPAALQIVGEHLGGAARRRLAGWRPGPGVFKVDLALDAPIPWADELSPRAGTIHVGGTFDEIAAAEALVARGEHPDRPFVLVSQPSVFDDSRAPEGKHTAWAYCHVPNDSDRDMTEAIVTQIERFAPGFRETILATATRNARQHETMNPNYVGGDIGGGRYGLRKVLQLGDTRPFRLADDVYLGSSAVPPGAGVHGMCGYLAARAVLAG